MKPTLKLIALALISFIISCKLPDHKQQTQTANRDTATVASQHPSWSLQSNIYEVNLRQYGKSASFSAFRAELKRLREMGVDILWFMPITPISVKDRKGVLGSYYAVKDYRAVNPEYGTIEERKQL